MKYIIMAGGDYHTETPKQLLEYGTGITIIERTIMLLQNAGVDDIAISTNDERFEWLGLPILHHENNFGNGGHWLEAFYPMDEPCCYIFGDVFFSPEAIKTIVNTETNSVEFFASAPPFHPKYIKHWAEPFAFKVQAPDFFRMCVNHAIELADQGIFRREPIAWELWQVIKMTPFNQIRYDNYVAINDYTCDVDNESDLQNLRRMLMEGKIYDATEP